MLLDSGYLIIKRPVANTNKGGLPKESYAEVFRSNFAEKTVGINRYFTAKANDFSVDLFVEIQRYRARTTDLVEVVSMVEPDLNGLYNVIQVQQIDNEDGLPVTDLSLQRYEGVIEP